jgi:hypothetical protein
LDGDSAPLHLPITRCFAKNQWQQIHHYFHVFDPQEDFNQIRPKTGQIWSGQKLKAFEKMIPIANYLRIKFRRLWRPSTYVSVDECMQGFTDRSPDIVTISHNPTPTGYKIWCLGDKGYISNFKFHIPGTLQGNGPQQIDYPT